MVGIIKRPDGKLLITKRKKDQLLGGLWEFPGGKVEPKESLETALIREIKRKLISIFPLMAFMQSEPCLLAF